MPYQDECERQNYFKDIYLKRLNRYGLNYQSRIQHQREEVFERLLLKSIYRVDFEYGGQTHPGLLERYKQDESEILGYFLTRVNLDIPAGTILMIPNKDMIEKPWMIYYLEEMKASGYNRYIVVKMTHFIEWKDEEGEDQSTWAYMCGPGNKVIEDLKSPSGRNSTVYTENNNASYLLMPTHEEMRPDTYIEIGTAKLKEAYRVTGLDRQTTPNVSFVTLDPVFIRDLTPAPEKTEEDSDEDFFWLEGGN